MYFSNLAKAIVESCSFANNISYNINSTIYQEFKIRGWNITEFINLTSID